MSCYYSRPQWTWERWQWRGAWHSLKFQHYWNLTIRLFNFISKTLAVVGVLLLCRVAVSVVCNPSGLGKPRNQMKDVLLYFSFNVLLVEFAGVKIFDLQTTTKMWSREDTVCCNIRFDSIISSPDANPWIYNWHAFWIKEHPTCFMVNVIEGVATFSPMLRRS